MKTISLPLLNHLKEPVVTLAVMVLINRMDGVTMAFTSWDTPILYNGVTYLPAIAMDPSGVKSTANSTTDQMDIIGAIDHESIKEEDIDAGRFDYAKTQVFRINPYNPAWGSLGIDITGRTGQVTYGDGSFQVDIDSLGKNLEQSIGEVITPICRVKQLGDAECKVNIASYRFTRTVVSVSADNQTIIFTDNHATGDYDYGMARFQNGLNYSLSMEIKYGTLSGSNTQTILLQEPMPYPIQVGDAVILEVGCDRRGITCRTKFNNLRNFHGEPYVPGNDYMISTGRPPS